MNRTCARGEKNCAPTGTSSIPTTAFQILRSKDGFVQALTPGSSASQFSSSQSLHRSEIGTRQRNVKVKQLLPFCVSDAGKQNVSPVEWLRNIAGVEEQEP